MASWDKHVIHRTIVEYRVPIYNTETGAPWSEVMGAIHALHNDLAAAGKIEHGADAPDDVIRIRADDEAVIVTAVIEDEPAP